MNLYFRLITFIIKAIFNKKHIGLLDEVKTPMRVLPNDLDINRHMNNGRYLTVMDFGRFDYIIYTGILRLCIKYKWSPILGSAYIQYKKPLALWQKYNIITKVECWDDKWFVMSQRFESNGNTMAIAYVRGLFRGKSGNIKPHHLFNTLFPNTTIPQSPIPSKEIQTWLNQH